MVVDVEISQAKNTSEKERFTFWELLFFLNDEFCHLRKEPGLPFVNISTFC